MPHQCLGCGEAFPQGSTQLLKGCPGCGGTRFFFSQNVLAESERSALKAEQSADVKHVLSMLLAENPDAGAADLLKSRSWDEWVSVAKPARPPTPETPRFAESPESVALPPPSPASSEAPAPPTETPVVEALRERGTPGTVQVVSKGSYEIDVEALMDANPVVIEKDGVFMIHLPSVFGSGSRRRRD